MDKPNRIAQVYGYAVCLVAIVVALITIASIVNSAFERANPLESGSAFGPSLTSFEAYKATYRQFPATTGTAAAAADTLPEAALKARYDALASDRVASVRYRTAREMTTNGILLLVACALFFFHWRWVRRLHAEASAG